MKNTPILFLLFIPFLVIADDSQYKHVRDNLFWPQLYDDAYETLYCGENKMLGRK